MGRPKKEGISMKLSPVLLVAVAEAIIDCSSNNGGCSHTCSNSECSCPPCWTLKSDGLGCQPEADKVTLSCGNTTMGLKVDKCVLDGYAAAEAYAGSDDTVAACKMQAVDNGDFFQVSSNLNDCGTAVDFSNESKLDYTNKLTIPAEVLEGGIILNAPLEWEYTCSYKTEYELEANMEMKSEIIQGSFKVEDAEFNFDFGFYSSINLQTKLDSPVFRVGNQINFAATMNNGEVLNKIHYVMTDCKVKNENGQAYTIWDSSDTDKCTGSPIAFTAIDPAPTGMAGFSYNGFQFLNNPPDAQTLVCDIRVCHEDNTSSACQTGCYAVNVDECTEGTHNCDPNAKCTDTDDGFTCECNAGYDGDGVISYNSDGDLIMGCNNIDECAIGISNCGANAQCIDTIGGFDCECIAGYNGDGFSCVNNDECAAGTHDCDVNAKCTDTDGGFDCECNAGYNGDGVALGMGCADADECRYRTDNCHNWARCTNTIGSFDCACYDGYAGDGVTSCQKKRSVIVQEAQLMSWSEAYSACQALTWKYGLDARYGYRSPIPRNAAEQEYINSIVGDAEFVPLGIARQERSNWEWVDRHNGEALTYTQWGANQPDSASSQENCVTKWYANGNEYWKASNCDLQQRMTLVCFEYVRETEYVFELLSLDGIDPIN